ncbi:MAG TPA: glycosyltransferase family A protein [Candidatus Obscuribacterales bacterium]
MIFSSLNLKSKPRDEQPIVVFILSFNRPLYLWVCLDSLFRHTGYPAKFVIADNHSSDPLVAEVIRGFERRRMFHQVYMCDENRPDRLDWMMRQHRHEVGDMFAFIESDVEVLPSPNGWLRTMRDLMYKHPKMWLLGSRCERNDFIEPELAKRVDPTLSDEQLTFLIKKNSPERMEVDCRPPLIEPHNPPGRLLLMRTALLDAIRITTDLALYNDVKRLGYEAKISTEVRHRHLSLLNFFDYADYDHDLRNRFMTAIRTGSSEAIM